MIETSILHFCHRCEQKKSIEEFSVSKKTGTVFNFCKDCVKTKRFFRSDSVKVTEKKCVECQETKTSDNFFNYRSSPDGLSHRCKNCFVNSRHKVKTSQSVKPCIGCKEVKKLDQFRKVKLAYDGLSTYCNECISWKERERAHGVTKVQYEKMFQEQNGLCAICAKPSLKLLYIDHCHQTKKVRGLLCNECNVAIGFANDDTEILSRAIKYLNNWKIKHQVNL